MTKLKVDDENGFEYLFLELSPCINGFVSCCMRLMEHTLKESLELLCLSLQQWMVMDKFILLHLDLAMGKMISHGVGF